MLDKDVVLLEESFKKYYFENFELIHVPDKTSEREFGYQKFNSGMNRHLTVKDDKELHLMLITNHPSDVYCSNAYYSFPNMPMSEKDWKGADLIFDIDSKDLNLECRINHTCIKCTECENIFTSHQDCPKCHSKKLEKKSLACDNCIMGAKEELKKLTKILVEDFDIKKENIHVYFSGNEGFHVHVYDEKFQNIGSNERSELVDYLMFRGTIPETFGFKKNKPERSSFPEFDDNGWRGRFSKHVFHSKSKRSKTISEIISKGYSNFQVQLNDMTKSVGVKIDPNVTMDIHRIFRLPGSINSKSGLSKVKCDNIESFNPFSDACFIDDQLTKVIANCPIEFQLKNKKFGPYNNEKISVPKFAAVYMICKGLANTV